MIEKQYIQILLLAASATVLIQGQNANRTVGPQKDGSIVVSDNQTLTPAGKMIDLGSPVRAKSIALNPNAKIHTGAVLLMGLFLSILIYHSVTG